MNSRLSLGEETSEISFRLEDYDDIFSDFDIRQYSSRALSVDFLDEIKRASRDKNDGGIDLTLHIPKEKRSKSHEVVIKERLVLHFKKHFHLFLKEKRQMMKMGIIMIIMGIICMLGATMVMFEGPSQRLFMSFFIVFLEPAAWFLLWEGMDQILFRSKKVSPDLDFYHKMADARGKIHFKSY